MEQHIYLVGLSYRTASVDVRERFALTGHCAPETWAIPLVQVGDAPDCIEEVLILSTCNRVEILAVGRGDVPGCIIDAWATACGRERAELTPHLYTHMDRDAVRHLFTVASSLDSMVLGEPQILGQLKDAYRKATMAQTTGHIINRLLHKSFTVAKRIRTETEVASSAVSISYAAVELAKRIFGDMAGYRAMLIGAGEMAELAATHLLNAGISKLFVANRTLAHAVELAEQFRGEAVAFERLFERLPEADIIISSTGAPEAILRARDVRGVLERRKNRPIFFIDIAVPRDIDPGVNNLDNVYLYDIDDLKEVVEENLEHRRDEADRAHVLVDDEVNDFARWLHSLTLQPTIMELLGRFEQVADDELAKTFKRLGSVDASTEEALRAMMRSVIRKLGHDPLCFLKKAHERGDVRELTMVRALFNLDEVQCTRYCRYRADEPKVKEVETNAKVQ